MDQTQALLTDILNTPLLSLSQHRELATQVVKILKRSINLGNTAALSGVSNNLVRNPRGKRSAVSEEIQRNVTRRTGIRQLEKLAEQVPTIIQCTEIAIPDCQARDQVEHLQTNEISRILEMIDTHRGDIEGLLRLDPVYAVGRKASWETAEPRLLDLMACDNEPIVTPQKWFRNMLSRLSYARSYQKWKGQSSQRSIAKFVGTLRVLEDQKELVYRGIRTGMKLVDVDNCLGQIHKSKGGCSLPQFEDTLCSASSLLLGSVSNLVFRMGKDAINPLAQGLHESRWNTILINRAEWLADCVRFYEDWHRGCVIQQPQSITQIQDLNSESPRSVQTTSESPLSDNPQPLAMMASNTAASQNSMESATLQDNYVANDWRSLPDIDNTPQSADVYQINQDWENLIPSFTVEDCSLQLSGDSYTNQSLLQYHDTHVVERDWLNLPEQSFQLAAPRTDFGFAIGINGLC